MSDAGAETSPVNREEERRQAAASRSSDHALTVDEEEAADRSRRNSQMRPARSQSTSELQLNAAPTSR